MTDFRSIQDVTRDEWLSALQLDEAEIPDCVIVEGSWWRAERQAWRLSYLSDVRELGVPDVFWGRRHDRNVAFCMAYGAPRAVEVIYMFSLLGAKLAIQIGTCGGLQPHLRPGDIILPDDVVGEDGVAHLFGGAAPTAGSPRWIGPARAALEARSRTVHVGKHVTFSSLFAESTSMMEAWQSAGFLSVDMETATTFSVAKQFATEAVSLLVVWDELTRGRRFLDPMDAEPLAALNQSNLDVYEVALELVDLLG